MRLPARRLLFASAFLIGALLHGAGSPPVSYYFKDPDTRKLVEAAVRGNVAGIDAALKAGADVNARGIDDFPSLT